MRVLRTLATALASIAIAVPSWGHGAEELGHHWSAPAYRTEMLTQIAIMTAVALAVLLYMWLAKTVKTRRSRG